MSTGAENDIHVKLSGSAIHKAVRNYIKDNLDESIKRECEKWLMTVLGERSLEKLVRDKLASFTSWYWKDEVRKIMREVCKEVAEECMGEAVMGKILTNLTFSLKPEGTK